MAQNICTNISPEALRLMLVIQDSVKEFSLKEINTTYKKRSKRFLESLLVLR